MPPSRYEGIDKVIPYKNRTLTLLFTLLEFSGYEESLTELSSKLKNIQGQINAVVVDKSKHKNDLTELARKLEKLRRANIVAKRKLEDLRMMGDSESVNVQTLVSFTVCLIRACMAKSNNYLR